MMYTINEAATKLNLSTKTLRRWEQAGKLSPSRTLGGQRRYTLDELQVLDAIKNGLITNAQELLSESQAAALLGVELATLRRYQAQGLIHPLVTSSGLHYPKSRLLSQARVASYSTTPSLDHSPKSNLATPPAPPSSATLILINILITLTLLLLYQIISNL